jgi:ParB-like chromosome segregation protein Spo0J
MAFFRWHVGTGARASHADRTAQAGRHQTIRSQPAIQRRRRDAVATSIREFGFRQPIVVDEQFVIIVGHTRYKAALKLNLDTVPVHIARGLSPAQAKAYRIADNQTARLHGHSVGQTPRAS